MARILSVGPNRESLVWRTRSLVRIGHHVRGAVTHREALNAAESQRFDVALICNEFPRGYAIELASELQRLMPSAVVLIIPKSNQNQPAADIQELLAGAMRSKAA